jgi:hypothetical protein
MPLPSKFFPIHHPLNRSFIRHYLIRLVTEKASLNNYKWREHRCYGFWNRITETCDVVKIAEERILSAKTHFCALSSVVVHRSCCGRHSRILTQDTGNAAALPFWSGISNLTLTVAVAQSCSLAVRYCTKTDFLRIDQISSRLRLCVFPRDDLLPVQGVLSYVWTYS